MTRIAHNPNADADSRSARPTIGITMGDPAGIGPEVIIKSLTDPRIRRAAKFVIYGLNETLTYAADRLEIDPFWSRIQHDSPRRDRPILDDIVTIDFDEFDGIPPFGARDSRSGGLSSKAFVEEAIADALRTAGEPRHIDAIVTAPISKQSWRMAGFKWPGHTELFAARTKAKRHSMMFISPRLRVALATSHIPLMDVRNVLTIGRVHDPIDLGHRACLDLGIENPRIAVCGLNPHAGEGGLLGDEDERLITPAVRLANESGINVTGPHPADTIFIKAAAGEYDLVVAMYHDQGLIPVKLLGWDSAVNYTAGLPIIRTSPDHGTAFDIAGTSKASDGSMRAAIELATTLATHRLAHADSSST